MSAKVIIVASLPGIIITFRVRKLLRWWMYVLYDITYVNHIARFVRHMPQACSLPITPRSPKEALARNGLVIPHYEQCSNLQLIMHHSAMRLRFANSMYDQ